MARESVTSSAFASLLMSGALLAGVVHMAFCVLFFQNGVWPLAWVNVGSVLLYAVVAVLLTRRRLGSAYVLMGLEVTGHAVLAVWSVGWDSGFHYYLMIVVPIVLASTVQDWPGKAALAVTVMLSMPAWTGSGVARCLSTCCVARCWNTCTCSTSCPPCSSWVA